MWKFLTKLTQEQLVPNEDTMDRLKSLSRGQREALYEYLTYLSYRTNKDVDRMSCLKIRNKLDQITFSVSNKSDGEKDPTKTVLPADNLPDTLKTDAI